MSPCPPLLKPSRVPRRAGPNSFALVATLALLAVATLLLVLFVTTTSSDRSASYTYSQSVKADQIARGGLHMVVGQLQAEMYKDALPDTGTGGTNVTIFTNLSSRNILPQANVTNTFLPSLVKMSTNAPIFSGGTNAIASYDKGQLQSTTISSTAPSLNGRSISTNVWNGIYLGQYPTAASAPYWLLISRTGPTNATGVGFGATGNTVNNPAITNPNYVLGRVAFAIYDEGGLLDVTAAGGPSSLSTAQLAQIKGTLAGADLTQVGITNANTFVQWRNAASASSASSYTNFVTSFASTNGFQQVYPGDSTFLNRQDLIKAAQNGTAGLTTDALPNLTTFTRELNAPSWAPSLNGATTAAAKFKYATYATNITTSPFTATVGVNKAGGENPNPFIPLVRYANAGTVTHYPSDGSTPVTYTVQVGDPLVQYRFPLDRLNWITPKGPSASLTTTDPFYNKGGTATAIRACFGLVWGPAENILGDANWAGINVWKYYGSNLSTVTSSEPQASNSSSSVIETLSDVAKESVVREPNFFELLQAGILSGSVALGTGSSQAMSSTLQPYVSLQFMRIAANILTQVQPEAYPINIEYKENSGGSFSIVASGAVNLPYLDKVKFVAGESPTGINFGTTTAPSRQIATYGLVGLWNPHQQSNTPLVRPPIRLYIQGDIGVGSGWANGSPTSPPPGNYVTVIPSTANNGTTPVNTAWSPGGKGIITPIPPNTDFVQLNQSTGYLNPYALGHSDAGSESPMGTSTTAGWTSSPSGQGAMDSGADPEGSYAYESFRLPDLLVNLQPGSGYLPGDPNGGTTAGVDNTSVPEAHVAVYAGSTANPFNLVMKYQDPSGAWVPYDYFYGVSTPISWVNPSLTNFLIAENLDTSAPNSATHPNTKAPFVLSTLDQVLHSLNGHAGTLIKDDPRAFRFGPIGLSGDLQGGMGVISNIMIDSIWSGSGNAIGNGNTTQTMLITGYGGASSSGAAGLPPEFGTLPAIFGTVFLPAYLTRNNTAYPNSTSPGSASAAFTAYQDPDGIQRIGDSGLFPTTAPVTGAATAGNPYYDPADKVSTAGQRTGDRPIILNRPFASVGELGYVFRDDPWRSLDFFSVFNGVSTSADSGLLDLFTVTDSPNPVVAGRVNLNTKNPLALQAILSGTMADALGNTSSSSQISNPSALASALVTYTSATTPQALVNKDQLVTRFNPTLPIGAAASSPFGSVDEQNVKFCREAFVRSLADVGQTRTWNLLIDLVAQAGKYPPTSTSLDQFNVEGERHYWLHVAIDRVTGKVIDQQLELVEP